MEITKRNPANVVWILATLIGLGLAGGLYWNNNRTLTNRFDQAEQQADSLLSVKFQLEGDNRDLKRQLETVADDNAYLTNRISNLHTQLTERDRSADKLRQTNTVQTRTIRNLNQNLRRLSTDRDSLMNQMVAMHDKLDWQSESNAVLLNQQNELKQKQNALDSQLVNRALRSTITADAFLVEVSKSNKKVTAKAKKANTLTVSLNVPASLNLEGMQEVYLSLTDQQQQPMIPALHNATVTLPDINEVISVHARQTVNFARSPQRITFSITPDTGIKPGIYRASVFTKDAYLGAVEFRLRDSFWFF